MPLKPNCCSLTFDRLPAASLLLIGLLLRPHRCGLEL
jgi:hypothetical protein